MLAISNVRQFNILSIGFIVFLGSTSLQAESNSHHNLSINITAPINCKDYIGPDFDQNCYVDLHDVQMFQLCLTGPSAGPPASGCEAMDIDADGDVDESDFTTLPPCNSGPGYVADIACEDPTYSPPTSLDRIDDELEAGLITETDALRFKVFEVFSDDRLPSRFYGPTYEEGTHVIMQLDEQYDSLSPEAQAELRPFLLPPDAPGSWYNLRLQTASSSATTAGVPTGNFNSLDVIDGSGKGVAVIKWPTTSPELAASAETVRAAMAGKDGVYTVLVTLMGRPPVSDENISSDINGGDGRYDVYLVPQGSSNYGVTGSYNGSVTQWLTGDDTRASYTVMDTVTIAKDFSGAKYYNKLRSNIAHEFMHAIQNAFNSDGFWWQNWWLDDATATWAEHYVFPDEQMEHEDAPHYLKTHDKPLEVDEGKRRYGAYLYFFNLVETYSADLLRYTYLSTETATSLEAVDNAVPNGISANWPAFAYYNWNDTKNPPVDGYEAMDMLKKGVKDYTVPTQLELVGKQEISQLKLKGDGLEPLSTQYFHYILTDTNIRSILFANGLTFDLKSGVPDIFAGTTGDETLYAEILPDEDTEHVYVIALIKQNGTWLQQPFNLSNTAFAPFCNDVGSESVEEIVIIMANGRFEDHQRDPIQPQGLSTRLWVSNMGCGVWEGTAQNIHQVSNSDETTSSTTNVSIVEFTRDTYTLSEIARGEGDFAYGVTPGSEVIPGGSLSEIIRYGSAYELSNFSASWSHFSSYDTEFDYCSESGNGSLQIDAVGGNFAISPFITDTINDPNITSRYRKFTSSMYFFDLNELIDGACVDDKGNINEYDEYYDAEVTTGFDKTGFIWLPIDPSGNQINKTWSIGDDYYELHLQSKKIP